MLNASFRRKCFNSIIGCPERELPVFTVAEEVEKGGGDIDTHSSFTFQVMAHSSPYT